MCVYTCHMHMCVYLHKSQCVHVQGRVYFPCVCMDVWYVEIF